MLLLLTALILSISGVLSFWLADNYKVKSVWVFFAWNSILYVPFLVRRFRGQFSRPGLRLFLIAWAIFHGAVMIALMRFVPLGYWPFALLLEGVAGFQAAYLLFGVVPDNSQT